MTRWLHGFSTGALASGIVVCFAAQAEALRDNPQPPAASEQHDEVHAGGLEEITVTARRREESLQDVPTAVTALTSKDIQELQIQGFEDVGQTVPNVYIQKQGGAPAAPQMQIRGISNGSLNLQVDTGIGLYIDGVYMGRPGGAAFDLADLERVEILRGPQGTLFGRNATGGAINLITAAPTGKTDLHAEATLGNFENRRYKGVINLPEWHGLAARFTFGHNEINGDVVNTAARRTLQFPAPFGAITTSSRGGDSNTNTGLLALRYTGLDSLKIDYKFDFTDWFGTLNYRQLGNFGSCVSFTATPASCITGAGLVTTVAPFDNSFSYRDRLDVPLEGTDIDHVHGHSLVAQYSITERISVKYIGGYRQYHVMTKGNQVYGASEFIDNVVPPKGVGGSFGGLWTPLFALRDEHQRQQSHELQLLGTTGSVDWIGGLFYFQERGTVNDPILLFKSIGSVNTVSVAGFDYFVGQDTAVSNKSTAGYVHGTWHISDFDLSGGIRHTRDDRSEHVVAAGIIGLVTPGNQDFSYWGSHTDFDASATYKIRQNNNIYAKYATGYVSGGTAFGNKFGAEIAKSYELGFKAEMLDRHLRLDTAVFDMRRSDTQIEGFTSIGYFMGRGREVTSKGVELESTYIPITGLMLTGAYGYTNVASSGQLRTFQPKHTAYLGANYEFAPIGGGMIPSARVDASWHSDVHRLACPAGQDQIPASDVCVGTPIPALDAAATIKQVTLLGARLSLSEIKFSQGITGRVALWGRNLLDQHDIQYNFTLGGPVITNTFLQPRTYGIDLNVDFR